MFRFILSAALALASVLPAQAGGVRVGVGRVGVGNFSRVGFGNYGFNRFGGFYGGNLGFGGYGLGFGGVGYGQAQAFGLGGYGGCYTPQALAFQYAPVQAFAAPLVQAEAYAAPVQQIEAAPLCAPVAIATTYGGYGYGYSGLFQGGYGRTAFAVRNRYGIGANIGVARVGNRGVFGLGRGRKAIRRGVVRRRR